MPQNGFVTLKVFNVLGKEIATLVNGQNEAGKHKVDFDATGLNSGVYFYKIESGRLCRNEEDDIVEIELI